MQWYFANNNERQGPVSEAEFQSLVQQGIIRPDTLVWRQGMGNWQPYAQVAATLPPPMPLVPSDLTAAPFPAAPGPAAAVPAPAYTPVAGFATTPRPAFRYGGFWIRVAAKVIDGLIMTPFLFGLFFYFMFPIFRNMSGDPNNPEMMQEIFKVEMKMMPLILLLYLAYDLFFLGKFSATPGKMALGLKVVRSDGSRIGIGRIIGRFFAERINNFIFCIGYIIAGFDDEKRALHDHLCDTRVVYKK